MIVKQTSVNMEFIAEHGASTIVDFAKSFMHNCELILLQQPMKVGGMCIVRGFSGSGYVDLIHPMCGDIAEDVRVITEAVELSKELNSHTRYVSCRIDTYDDQIAARVYYENLNILN